MKLVVIGFFSAGVLGLVGCADGRGVPTGPSAVAAVSGVAATASSVQATGRPPVLLLTKTCGPGTHCTVETSSSGPIPAQSDIEYFGPLLENRTTSRIRVTTPGGDTAEGYCSLSYRSGNGTCVITGGTGALAGLHASLKVSSDFSNESYPNGLFTWEGPYHFEP